MKSYFNGELDTSNVNPISCNMFMVPAFISNTYLERGRKGLYVQIIGYFNVNVYLRG